MTRPGAAVLPRSSLGLPPFLLHWGWPWLDGRAPRGSRTPSATACLLGLFFFHGASSPFLLQLPSQGRQHLCGSPGPLGCGPHSTCQKPLPGPGAGEEQPFEKISLLGTGKPGLSPGPTFS